MGEKADKLAVRQLPADWSQVLAEHYEFGWNDAIEAVAEKIEHYRDVVKRSDEDPTEWKAYNIAAATIRKLKKP